MYYLWLPGKENILGEKGHPMIDDVSQNIKNVSDNLIISVN